MRTNDLIETLAAEVRPVRRLPPPGVRTAIWLAIALPYLAAVVLAMSPRPDIASAIADRRFLVEQGAALATAIAAAVAALASTVPGRSRAVLLLPIPPLAVWLGSLGQGCFETWVRTGTDGLVLRPDWACFPGIALVGALPAAAMVVMLRRGAPLSPHATVAAGALAAAALGNFGLRLFHPQDAALIVLVWQFGSVAVMSAAAGWLGPHLLRWRHLSAGG